jgi:hypothetical protein
MMDQHTAAQLGALERVANWRSIRLVTHRSSAIGSEVEVKPYETDHQTMKSTGLARM